MYRVSNSYDDNHDDNHGNNDLSGSLHCRTVELLATGSLKNNLGMQNGDKYGKYR